MNRSKPIEVTRLNWRIDDDGMLRVTANILKEGIFPYKPDSSYPAELAQKTKVLEFISRRQFTEDALATLEGKPVIVGDHEMLTVDEEDQESIEARKIGSVAGKPKVTDDGFIQVDLLITDPETIRRIQDRDLIEVSAGYRSLLAFITGMFDGLEYDAEQTDIRFNHILILPYGKGRCGRDVKILNKKEEITMPIKISRMVGNSQRDYVFENENDAKVAEQMAKETEDAATKTLSDRVNAMEGEVADKEKENEGLVTEKAGLEERVAVLEEALKKLLYLKENEQAGQEEAIIAEEMNADDDKEADAAKKDVEKANSLEERRSAIVKRVARMNGIDADAWSQEQIDANFSMLANRAKKQAEKRDNGERSSKVEGVRNNSMPGNRPGPRERIAARQAERKQ